MEETAWVAIPFELQVSEKGTELQRAKKAQTKISSQLLWRLHRPHNLTIFINMLTCKPWQGDPGSQLLLETSGPHIDDWATSHISQVQRACNYSQQDNWRHNSLKEGVRERECTHEGYIRVPQMSSAWGKLSNSAQLFACSHHSSRLCCCCP